MLWVPFELGMRNGLMTVVMGNCVWCLDWVFGADVLEGVSIEVWCDPNRVGPLQEMFIRRTFLEKRCLFILQLHFSHCECMSPNEGGIV